VVPYVPPEELAPAPRHDWRAGDPGAKPSPPPARASRAVGVGTVLVVFATLVALAATAWHVYES